MRRVLVCALLALATLAFAISNGEAYGASLATRVNVPVAAASPPGSAWIPPW